MAAHSELQLEQAEARCKSDRQTEVENVEGTTANQPNGTPEKQRVVSQKKLRANRENAKKSTGPRTERGKAFSTRALDRFERLKRHRPRESNHPPGQGEFNAGN